MQVFCRKAGGKDPLGDVLIIHVVEGNEQESLLRAWPLAEAYNRSKIKEGIATLQAGDLILNVKTGKLLSLAGKALGKLEREPLLDLPRRSEPRLL